MSLIARSSGFYSGVNSSIKSPSSGTGLSRAKQPLAWMIRKDGRPHGIPNWATPCACCLWLCKLVVAVAPAGREFIILVSRSRDRPPITQGGLREPFWPHLGPPGASFSSLRGVLFEARARSATQTKALFEITGQKVFRDRCGPDVQRPLST